MNHPKDDILDDLQKRLELILLRQETLYKEVNDLRASINSYKLQQWQGNQNTTKPDVASPIANIPDPPKSQPAVVKEPIAPLTTTQNQASEIRNNSQKTQSSDTSTSHNRDAWQAPKQTKSSVEKFIGENLINKIGIIITVIGVAIGAKYSIENNLISPLTRIILGYLSGLALLVTGIKLKKNYTNYSAVLVSGAIAIFYFITFAGYSFYDLIPQAVAFVLMFMFTVFSAVAAIHYNKQVIAHISLVGAYAVPFLLSDGSGKVAILFSYMAIINIGILFIAFKKYWKPLYFVSFALTWMIYSTWTFDEYVPSEHLVLGLGFTTITFLTFYAMFLSYKFIKKEDYQLVDGVMLLVNTFLFYGLGYYIISEQNNGGDYVGLFTAFNAIVHFIVALFIYKRIPQKSTLFYLIAGLVLTFITITIPVQLEGNWVTLLWACEAVLLFWLGRSKNIVLYEKAAFLLMLFTFCCLIINWADYYNLYTFNSEDDSFVMLFNESFMTSLLVLIAYGCIYYLQKRFKREKPLFKVLFFNDVATYMVSVFLVIVSYIALRLEISMYWEQAYERSKLVLETTNPYSDEVYNRSLLQYGSLSVLLYSLLYFSLFTLLNLVKIKSFKLGIVNIVLNIIVIAVFLTQGLLLLSEMRERYLEKELDVYFNVSVWNLNARYVALLLLAILVYTTYILTKKPFMDKLGKFTTSIVSMSIYIIALWVLSSELLHWMDFYRTEQSYKLGLSILWGSYALFMVVMGIWRGKRYLRIGGIALFGATLLKLFFYDIAHLNTIAKTIVFVSLGLLLLIISFLYNKFKDRIVDDAPQNK